jgi:hypothetical protein
MNFIFVFCGGKSGSCTLHETFKKNNYDSIKVHSNQEYQIKYGNTYTIFDIINITCNKYNNVYIIDSYRTPIERKISSLFENINTHLPNYKNLSIHEIIDFFNNNLLHILEEYHSINEVFKYYNLQLFNSFDFEKKYNIVKYDNKIFIKLLFKDINIWNQILSNIFNKEITIVNSNLSNNKDQYNLYKLFLDNYKVPKKYIKDILINDNEFKIYNTLEEQKNYIEYWLNKSY